MQLGVHRREYPIHEVAPYINWIYFFHAWGFSPSFAQVESYSHCASCATSWINTFPAPEREKAREAVKLYREAIHLLTVLDARFVTRGNVNLLECNSKGNDLLLYTPQGTVILPLLRQQSGEPPYLCLADFIRPAEQGIPDTLAVFAATVDEEMELSFANDDYRHLLAQTLADRLAEATAERLHEEVRKILWGYAAEEHLTMKQLHNEEFQGIRPAVGYPSLPDIGLNHIILPLVDGDQLGIKLTPHAMMQPHASVSGLMLANPKSRYFSIGKIGLDQLQDYALRRNMTPEKLKPFLQANL